MANRAGCEHFDGSVHEPLADRCQECGSDFNLRVCTACGHVGCCESQQGHNTKHATAAAHPIIGGNAPGTAPTSVDSLECRFIGVYTTL